MRWSSLRLATGAVLAAWAAVFWFLLASGRSALYLSSRTAWVVPVGALVLTIAGAGRLVTARTDRTEAVSGRGAFALGLIVLPAVLVVAMPPAALGSYAASRRSAITAGVVPSESAATGEITLVDVAAAKWSGDIQRQLIRRAGTEVSFVGFVTEHPGAAADEFVLTRFIVSCCVADALSVQVRVVGVPPGKFRQDQWVRVTGNMYPLENEVIVDAAEVEPVPRPARPYLNV